MFDVALVKNHFDKSAVEYDRHALLQRAVRAHAMGVAARYWKGQEHLLDMGCGTGAFAREARQQKHRWHITSLDIAPAMCALAGRAVNADAQCMPFAPGSFDGIFSSLMLQWANTPSGVFLEMARVAKAGSISVLTTLTQGTLHELRHAFALLDDAPHVSPFTPAQDVIADAAAARFSLVSAEQKTCVEHYGDVIALMRSLQAIGATNTNIKRKRGLYTSRQFTRLEHHYAQSFGDAQGLPATWQVLTLALKKA